MIPINEDRQLVSSGAEESIKFGISTKDSVHVMQILRDQLYSDKILAVLREIGANALDANAMAGRQDVPIDVTLPTLADPTLTIRDCGPGLSREDVRTVFSQYGASTKRNSNESVGMLGIGSKSPFAYTDSFVVTSWHGGKRAIYNAVIDRSGAGQIDLLDEIDCDPSETGLEVKVAVRPADSTVFEERAQRLFVHFEPRPNINITLPNASDRCPIPSGSIDTGAPHGFYDGKWTAVMGCIPYSIDIKQLESGLNGVDIGRAVRNISGTLRFDIGELEVAASRESLKYSDSTRVLLIERLNGAIAEYVQVMLHGIDSLSNWEKRLRIMGLAIRRLPIPSHLNSFNESMVTLALDSKLIGKRDSKTIKGQRFCLESLYNRRMGTSHGIAVDRTSRLVIRDDRRAISGFQLGNRDHVIRPADEGEVAQKQVIDHELDGFLKKFMIDGIEVIRLSSLEWNKPARKTCSVPRDRDRERAKSLTLDLQKPGSIFSGSPSQRWVPRNDPPRETDVFVILNAYRIGSGDTDSFYFRVKGQASMLAQIGLSLPSIIGYRSTKAKPVSVASCMGTEYSNWCDEALPKLLMDVPEVRHAAVAMRRVFEYDCHAAWTSDTSGMSMITTELGVDHPIVTTLNGIRRDRMTVSGSSVPVTVAAREIMMSSHVLQAMIEEDSSNALQIISNRYPLLKTVSWALSGVHARLWIDYVRLIDRQQEKT